MQTEMLAIGARRHPGRRAIPFFAGQAAQWYNYMAEVSGFYATDAYLPEARAVLELQAASADEARHATERLRAEADPA